VELAGKVALVTGASRRIGRAVALALAGQGADIAVHYGRSADAAAEAVDEIRELGVGAEAFAADLREPDEIAQLFAAIDGRFGRLDVLVNSAATFRKLEFDSASVEDWDRAVAVNLRAPFLCTQQASRLMRRSEREAGQPALVVNIADLSGLHPWLGYSVHGVSKAGLLHLTMVTARELAPEVRVNAVVPGPMLPPPGVDATDELWRRLGESVPLGRTGEPSMIGDAVVYLAEADYVTGAVLPVDGGEHLLGPVNH
jgi:NAD(P)-dependent dehydrogenase (short-subunit alcohol dehydrogenase family)